LTPDGASANFGSVRTLALAFALVSAAGLAGCRKKDCVSVCEARNKVIHCSAARCKELCDKLHTSPVCGAQFKRFEACLLEQPVDKWECDDAREPALKAGVCGPERGEVMKCLQGTPPPAAPPAK
jgi:hypothetical protein